MNLTIRTRLFAAFAILIGALLIVGWVGIAGMQSLWAQLRVIVSDDLDTTRVIHAANIDLLVWNRAVINHILEDTDEGRVRYEDEASDGLQSLNERLNVLAADRRLPATALPHVRELIVALAAMRAVQDRILALSRVNRDDEARLIARSDLRQLRDATVATMATLVDVQARALDEAAARAGEQFRSRYATIVAVLALAIVVAVVVGYLVTSSIVVGLGEAVGTARRLADGDVAMEVGGEGRGDEIGILMRAFRAVVESSRRMAEAADRIAAGDLTASVNARGEHDRLGRALADMVRNLREQIAAVTQATNVVAASSSQIATSTAQLAASTAEAATAVSETAATMEEVRQTAQLASEKAKQIADSTQTVLRLADEGRQASGEAYEGMGRIRAQMEAISDSILRLSEQNQTIGEILTAVEDLAEQSNLLAVNAAIEAMRAGDEGKGFSVVAEEIRNLAEQSKKATTQIRGVLNDVRKATGAAVMAAEQGAKTVESGAMQSSRAGTAIGALIDGTTQAARATTQIAASSQQQLAGVDQVALALANIRTSSEQNASSTRLAETAARSLTDLGAQLQALVARYRC